MHLPPPLQAALDAELRRYDPRRLARVTNELVERYRGPRAGSAPVLRSEEDVAAYAAYRMPATFAALHAACAATRDQWVGPAPRTLLDAGSGPGTALWAATATWPELERATLLERDSRMLALSKRLAGATGVEVRWSQVDLLATWQEPPHDLVTCAYVLNEIPAEQRAGLLTRLWEATAGVLLLLEPGTPAGFAVVRAARAQLIAAGATVLAPCPHDAACPLPPGDWCHFAQRVARSRLHRAAKGGALAYEDEKFSYVALGRALAPAIAGRVLRRPEILPGRVVLRLCTPDGLRTETRTRSDDRARYRAARDLAWGDALLPEE